MNSISFRFVQRHPGIIVEHTKFKHFRFGREQKKVEKYLFDELTMLQSDNGDFFCDDMQFDAIRKREN